MSQVKVNLRNIKTGLRVLQDEEWLLDLYVSDTLDRFFYLFLWEGKMVFFSTGTIRKELMNFLLNEVDDTFFREQMLPAARRAIWVKLSNNPVF